MAEKFYVTTAIDYVNAPPHIGHAYQKIVADVLARWNKLQGKEVLFVTGTDEHGKKVEESAKKTGKNPKEFVDEVSEKFKEAWKALNIKYDRFIRTTDKDHKKVVEDFIKKCNANGDIYLGEYEGLYCTGCEAYYTEKDCPDGVCQLHKRPLEKIKEETYFFRLSKYQKFLLDLYKKHPEFILPTSRRNEIINRVKEGLKDLSITRTSFDWGIPFPLDKKHITYVWFEALISYYTATREKGREKFWGKLTTHLLGKDNTWFHTVYWPAMLKSAGIELPKTIFNHGFLTFNGQKISKSLGNAISPVTLVEKYGADSVRYFCLRQFPFATGEDGDFNEIALVKRYNDELANKLGNLVSRTSALAEKYGIEKTPNTLVKKFKVKQIGKLIDNYELDKTLNEIFAFIDTCNEFIQSKKPWETHNKKVLYQLVESIREIAKLLSPFIPESAEKISKIFKTDKIKKAPILFTKIDVPAGKPNLNKSEEPKEIMEGVTTIQYADFEKLDLRVAEIQNVENIEGADKLYKLDISIGDESRTICAGIKEFYSHDDLKGKKIIVLTNLVPRKLRGIESQGMLLAASNKDHTSISLITPDIDIEAGSVVG
ncbi:MAG: methionine--tRNA ligase [Nanoarchaeota archaeon]|nr:methionine--tRNA ligase [Nanoarchaeota archaeon]